MEEIYIPNLSSIRKASKDCIDRPATVVEVLRLRCDPEDTAATKNIISDVFTKLARHHVDERKFSNQTCLFRAVRDLTLELTFRFNERSNHTAYIINNSPKFLRILKQKFLRTVETMNDDLAWEVKRKIIALEHTTWKHQRLISALQKAQKTCLQSQTKFIACRDNFLSTRSYWESVRSTTTLTEKEFFRMEDIVSKLEKTSKTQERKVNSDRSAYVKLLSEEHHTRQRIEQLSCEIREAIKLELVDRIQGAVYTLKELAGELLPQKRGCPFVEKVSRMDVHKLADEILSRDQATYTYPNPMVFADRYASGKPIPDAKISKM